jgi:hypothetical protein
MCYLAHGEEWLKEEISDIGIPSYSTFIFYCPIWGSISNSLKWNFGDLKYN